MRFRRHSRGDRNAHRSAADLHYLSLLIAVLDATSKLDFNADGSVPDDVDVDYYLRRLANAASFVSQAAANDPLVVQAPELPRLYDARRNDPKTWPAFARSFAELVTASKVVDAKILKRAPDADFGDWIDTYVSEVFNHLNGRSDQEHEYECGTFRYISDWDRDPAQVARQSTRDLEFVQMADRRSYELGPTPAAALRSQKWRAS